MENQVSSFINTLRSQLNKQQSDYIKVAMKNNFDNLKNSTNELRALIDERSNSNSTRCMLSERKKNETPIQLPLEQPLPRHITWIPIHKNQKITESELASRKYQVREAKQKIIFSSSEDHILKETISKFGSCDLTFDLLAKSLDKNIEETKERYRDIMNNENIAKDGDVGNTRSTIAEKHQVMDTFDKLYCRRCHVFDCPTHGLIDYVILPREKLKPSIPLEINDDKCSTRCYKLGESRENLSFLSWSSSEKDLLLIGVKIFENNSCFIARNMFDHTRTCWEIHQYLNSENYKEDEDSIISHKMTPHLQVSSLSQMKSSVKDAESENLTDLKPHYTPCKCQLSCGSQCACYRRGGCEKSCGCPRSCIIKNKGCGCYRGSCITKNCPCFAAERECDPDICKNCKLGCGDDSLGRLIVDNGNNTCQNMKIFLGQCTEIFLGPSDMSGLGVFLKKNVYKGDYIGEYIGELIAREDVEDLVNKTYLFSLDDQFVIDSLRMGSSLKFVNHSDNPNCYAKVVRVMGDNRVGFYAAKNIQAGEELLINYHYPQHLQPDWLKKLHGDT